MSSYEQLLKEAAEAVVKTRNGIAVTGAGISVESGIEDFRSPGGLWSRYPPGEYASLHSFFDNPDKVWGLWHELGETLKTVKPNAAHEALAVLEEMGHIEAVITQNIDGLHQAAGSRTVIEYHGNASQIVCPSCKTQRPLEFSKEAAGAPRCEDCGGPMKPDVILFDEMIPEDALVTSDMLSGACEIMIVVGTSAQVYPAASLPYKAREAGAVIIECNLEKTAFTDVVVDFFLQGPAGTTLPQLLEEVKRIKAS